jgi:hypothetical protein
MAASGLGRSDFEKFSRASGAAKELQISPFDQGDRVMDEAVSPAAGMRIFPLDGGELGVIGGEHFRRDVARSPARVMNVESVEKLDQPLLLKRRKAKRSGKEFDTLATKTAHKAQRDVEPEFKRNVGRQ